MSGYKYLIIGGGMTADSAVKGIREIEKSGTIAVFTEEKDPPYNRPPLSKSLWKGDPIDPIWRGIENDGVDFFGSTRIAAIETSLKTVKTVDGKFHNYEKLLLATGGKPRTFSFSDSDVIYFRTLEDYRRLRALSESLSDFIVIGGGFIGSEIAAALTMNGKSVTMIFPEDGIGSKVYPHALSSFLKSYYREKGVNVISGASVAGIEHRNGRFSVRSNKGGGVLADAVVAGLGIIPNVELAQGAGIPTDNGIIVDEFLKTTNPDI